MRDLGSEHYTMKEALVFMESIPGIDNPLNPLRECLHMLVWHKAVDRVRWLLENKEMVMDIAECGKYPLEGDLHDRFCESVSKLKRLNR